jgi:signal transduction histidine kinase
MSMDDDVPPELLARENTAAAVEAERRRLAGLLQSNIVEPLNLLLSQANAYEQTIGANPTARMAVSVLASLARQVLQQVRDLEANLHPTILEALGLEPALEALVAQAMRAHGLQITCAAARLNQRLPSPLETALFRAAQDALDRAVRHARASQVAIRLSRRDDGLTFTIGDNGFPGGEESLRAACRRLEELGCTIRLAADPFELSVRVPLSPPIQLTPRELETLQLLAAGLSNKEIARALSVSPRTVNFHLDNLYSKLGVNSRTEAAMVAVRHGLVKPPPD